jgi:hypothetical protein
VSIRSLSAVARRAKKDSFEIGTSTETGEKNRERLWPRVQVPRPLRSGLRVAYRSSVERCSRARSTREEDSGPSVFT